MACATPALAFRCGSVPEVIADVVIGKIVDSEEERDPLKYENVAVDICPRPSRVSAFIQTGCLSRPRLRDLGGRQQGFPGQEADMTEADLFRQYAKEAMHSSSQSKSEDERRGLEGLACTWAQAALTSERVFGSSFRFVAARHS